jgi:hypothetical protein
MTITVGQPILAAAAFQAALEAETTAPMAG